MYRQVSDGSLYQLRLAKEQSIDDDVISERMKWHLPILSQNSKCGISLDLPVAYCKPTKACADVCYACQGTQMFYRSIVKSLSVGRMIDADPERVARKIIDEAQGRSVRIAGSGEILPKHKSLLDFVSEFGGNWWGLPNGLKLIGYCHNSCFLSMRRLLPLFWTMSNQKFQLTGEPT